MSVNADILLSVPEAQLHEVENGKERLREWGELQLVTHTTEAGSGLWVQIGKTEWCLDTSMPTLEAAPNTFMFAMAKGRFYSILLSAGTPAEVKDLFTSILTECTAFEVAGAGKLNQQDQDQIVNEVAEQVANDEDLLSVKPDYTPGQSPSTSQRILSGAAAVQEKMMQSANWASQKIIAQADAYKAKHEATQNPVKVSPGVQRTVRVARRAAEAGSSVANRIAGGLADISIKIADAIIAHLGPHKYGEELNDPNKRPHAAKEVASAALVAAVGIYDSMEQASRVVLSAGGQASGDFIGHKYGQEAGQVMKDSASTAVTSGMTVMTMQKLGLKKIARRIAKRTAHGLVKAYLVPGQNNGTNAAQGGQQAANQQAGAATQSSKLPAQGSAQGLYGAPPTGQQQQHQAHAMQMQQPGPVHQSAQAPEYKSPFTN